MNLVWPHGDPNVVIRSILARPEFRDLSRSGTPSLLYLWLVQAIDALRRLLHQMLQGSPALAHVPVYVVLAILYAFGALGLLVVGFLVATTIMDFAGRKKRLHSRNAAGSEETLVPEKLRRDAGAFAERGDYGRAIALLFRAALFVLDRTGLVPFDASRTPGEYRRLARRAMSAGADAFDEVTRRFVIASFGVHPADREDYEAAARSYQAFLPATARA